MASPRAEMVLLREALEGVVAPEIATALLFDALEASGGTPPSTLDETRTFAEGALVAAVQRRVPAAEAAEILRHIQTIFARAAEHDGLAIDVQVDDLLEENGSATSQMAVLQKAVPVVVLGGTRAFADRIAAALGHERVDAIAVATEAAMRKAVLTHAPLLVLVDGTSPAIDAAAIVPALRDVPETSLPVLWGAETQWGQAVVQMATAAGVKLVTLDRREGIEPLLDMVLARFRGA